jgi:hypothetical protein
MRETGNQPESEVMKTQLELAVEKLRTDLDWRGPGGKTMRNIVLPREQALAVLDKLTDADRALDEWLDQNPEWKKP